MAIDDSYELTPHRELAELKRQLQELRSRVDKASPKELINSMNALAKSMDAMLKLFAQAVEELKYEDREESLSGGKESINEKLDEIISQNKVLADGMVAVSEMIEDLTGKKSQVSKNLQPPMPQPPIPPEQNFQPPTPEPQLNDLPELDQPPRSSRQGPVAMPAIPFSDFKEPKPKKKGLFGRLKG
mgnify:CR=1 FL=1